MEIGLLSAFVGGVLALLSPCGALLLPAFFASTVGSGPRLWWHALVFYLGLLVVLVPLGLGAVLTMAAASGDLVAAGALLAVYGAGMGVPLLVLAAVWGRLGARARSALRGRSFTVAGRTLHSTSVITGMLVIAVGVLFWTTNGLVDLSGPVSSETLADLQDRTEVLSDPVVDSMVVIGLAALVLVLWHRARGRSRAVESVEGDVPADESNR